MAKPKPNLSWIGRTIGGRYKIEAFLDQGGMSTVYKASDPNLQRTVAIKMIHPHLSSNPEFVRRFEREASAVARLRHPNIVQVFDFNHDNNVYYMVMEYVRGNTLKTTLKHLSAKNRRIPLADTLKIITSICEAAAYAHEQDMIHRDLKPANVMLTPKAQPILMDFGVAKMLDGQDETATGTVLGTAKYMSPEQARGKRPDERSDIYALGVLLYEMVAGQPPFDADTTVAILMKHVNDPVPDIRKIQNNVPGEIVEIINRSLMKDPAERYQETEHMVAALKLIGRLGQASQPVADAQRTVSSRKRQPSEAVAAPPTLVLPDDVLTPPVVKPAGSQNKLLWLGGAAAIVLFLLVGMAGLLAYLVLPTLNPLTSADKNLPSSEGMVQIEGNTYLVGLDAADQDHAPEQQVELAEFWIDQREVTNANYAEFLATTDNQPPVHWTGGTFPEDQADHPVKGVTWEAAVAYCQWANKRLPAEAEWEVSARGTEGRLYPWGNQQNAVQLPRSGTYAVGSKTTNQSPYGVFDMAGNVWEWVGDNYAPVTEGHKVLRGGANDFLKDMAYRLHGDPTIPTMSASAGLRCAANEVKVEETEIVAGNGILYEDSFDNPGSGWPIQSEGTLFFGYHPPDFYHVEVSTPETHAVISRQPNIDNATVEAEVLVNHTATEDGDFRYGLALRRSGDNYYAFTVSSRTMNWYVLKSSPAGLDILAQGSLDTLQGFAPAGFTPENTDTLRVDANGSTFVFHVNDQPVAQVIDSDYTDGEIGFFSEIFDETLTHVHFDSLVIREVEMEPVEITDILLDDQFTDPATGWPIEDIEGQPYRIGYHPPDFYHVEPRAANESVVVSDGQTFTDISVESEAFVDHTDTGNGDYRYGLVVRRAGDDFYAFTISPRSGTWQVLKSSSSGLEVLAEDTVDTLRGFAPVGFTPDKRDNLQIEADGSTFTFYINNEAVTQISDEDYSGGEVGFYAETFDETLAHVHYESLIIKPVAQ